MNARHFELGNTTRRIAATGVAAVALAGFAENTSAQPNASYDSTEIEAAYTPEAAANPQEIAERVIFEMNNRLNGPHPNQVYGGALLIKEGTFVNSGPVAAAERSRQTLSGTARVPRGMALLVQMPRVVRYGGTDWAVGFINDGDGGPTASAVSVEQLKWFNLGSPRTNLDTYAYSNAANPKKPIQPRLLKVGMDPDADLVLREPFNAVAKPPILQLTTVLKGNNAIKSQLNYLGLKNLNDRYKPKAKR